jgi:hypothetical protein
MWWPLLCQDHGSQDSPSRILLPTLFSDIYTYVSSYEACQFFPIRSKLPAASSKPVVVEALFQQWRLECIGKFHENYSNGFTWILKTIDYFTWCVEAIPMKEAKSRSYC